MDATAGSLSPVSGSTSGPSILVVDDTVSNLQVLTSHLESQNYVTLVARSGQEALERAVLAHPDLILLDVVMPYMDGFETCRRLKQIEATRDIPVIFMTALAATDEKIEGFRAGAVDYVTKPLNAQEVLARVETHLTLASLRHRLALQNQQLRIEIGMRIEAQAALEKSNSALEQLAYVASHDMQEPLRMIASYIQLIKERYVEQLDADGQEFLGHAIDGAKRMQTLILDLLAFSRVDSNTQSFAPVDLKSALATARLHLRVAIEESGAVITTDELPTVFGDRLQLVQLFQNLIANSIKFRSTEKPAINVAAQTIEGEWQLSVCDNGIGIAPEHHQRIFVLFQRLHGRQAYDGTGIGLALCKRIVERHGGRIWVEPGFEQGSAFRFTLPLPTESMTSTPHDSER